MGGKQTQRPPWERLRAVARRQRGLFTFDQAVAAGFPPSTVYWRIQIKKWVEIAPRVYRAGLAPNASWSDELAALTLSTDGVAYGASAAALYTLIDGEPTHEVVVPRGHRNRNARGLHSSIALPPSDLAWVQGIRATMPARTLIDFGRTRADSALADAIDRAIVLRLVNPAALQRRAIELRAPARPGARRVLALLASQHPDIDQARSLWEARALRLFAEWGLPDPECNYEVSIDGQRRILDCAWPPPKVCFEFDGFGPHVKRKVFDDDRPRQNALVDAGWKVFRATSTTLEREPDRIRDQLTRALS